MTKFNKTMEDIFDLPPAIIEGDSIQEYIPAQSDLDLSPLLEHDLKNDYEETRNNLNSLLAKGNEAIDSMLAIARETERARDFEVAGNMIKNMVDATKELIELQKSMRQITGKKDTGTTNIKNAVFVGSTTELLKAMKEIKNNE